MSSLIRPVFQQELDAAKGLTAFVEPHGDSDFNEASDYFAGLYRSVYGTSR